jgi:hypothetical protein
MRSSNKIVIAGLGLSLAFGLSAGTGLAQAATTAPTAKPVTPACASATQQVTLTESRVAEATAGRDQIAGQVTAQKASRQRAINAADVTLVGKYNIQLGSSTASYNTMDSAVATAQAQLVQTRITKNATC